MGKVKSHFSMVMLSWVTTLRADHKVMESTTGPEETFIKEILRMATVKDSECGDVNRRYITVRTKKTKKMALDFIFGLMAISTKVNFKATIATVTDRWFGQTEAVIKENGV
jgi:hypothetical protein